MGRLTIAEKLALRKEHTPSAVLYWILMWVIRILNKTVNTSFTFKARPSEEKGPVVLVSNHASRMDYLFTAPACYPKRLNYVVGYNEFFRFPSNILLRIAQVIPKKNFTPDVHCICSIRRVVRDGGSVCFMPEGMSSITGMCQPVMPGTGKLVKSLGVPVYYTIISGGYLTYTKHCLDRRKGRVEVTVDKMFSPQDLSSLSPEQIEDRMNKLLAHDDYIWNETAGVDFAGGGKMAEKLDTLLYMCPKCGAMYQMSCEGDVMRCKHCGNAVELDSKYRLHAVGSESVCPERVTDWTLMERRKASDDVAQEGFRFSERVKLGVLPKHKSLSGAENTAIICGEGTLSLDASGLGFSGSLKGERFDFKIPCQNLPTFGMCTDISRFYTFLNGEFLEFYPEGNDALRWMHLVEEMHRFRGGRWQACPYRHS